MNPTHFDSLILGGGSAGCVLASRLSEDPDHRVGLVEAGPDYGPAAAGGWPEQLSSAMYRPGGHDWGYVTHANGKLIKQYRGRVLGGCSTINACGITWPTRADLDGWAALGLPGWDFDSMLPHLQRVEADRAGSWPGHGRDGYLTVTEVGGTSALLQDLTLQLADWGIPALDDFNDPDARQGVGTAARNTIGMERIHLARAYIDPARARPNLLILADTLVDRLLWAAGRVRGVMVVRDGVRQELTADRVILAGGAIGTAAILQRSGIGDGGVLRPVLEPGAAIHHLPGVGGNLWDQPGLGMAFAAAEGAYDRLGGAGGNASFGRMPFVALASKFKTDPGLDWFDLHSVQRHAMMPLPMPGMSFYASQLFLLTPSEAGSVTITSADPDAAPLIAGGVGASGDLDGLSRAIEFHRRLMATDRMRHWIGAEILPGPGVAAGDLPGWVYDNLDVYHHVCGTATLGPASDPLAVTGADGRIHGFDNLYAADASIMPIIPRAAVHIPVLGIAEKIAWELSGR